MATSDGGMELLSHLVPGDLDISNNAVNVSQIPVGEIIEDDIADSFKSSAVLPTKKWTKYNVFILLCNPAIMLSAFTIMIMTIGILIVCFTAPKQNKSCHHVFKKRLEQSMAYDSRPISAIVSDLNNDDCLDIVVAHSGTHTVGIFWGNGNGTFQSQVTYAVSPGSEPYSVAVGDINNDHKLDIITANHGSNSISIFIGRGNRSFEYVHHQSLGSSRPSRLICADLNLDKCLDLVLVNSGTDSISILYGHCNASFGNPTIHSTGYDSRPIEIAIADVNQDTHMDIVVANSGTNSIVLFTGDENRSFSSGKLFSTGAGSQPAAVAIGDLNSDGHVDIIVCNRGSSTIGIFFGSNDGMFRMTTAVSFGKREFHPQLMVLTDFNQDSILDIAVASINSSIIVALSGTGNGSFVNAGRYVILSESSPISLLSGDFNNDNRLDFATVNMHSNEIVILLAYVRTFSDQTTYSTGPFTFPHSVTIADFNRDSFDDLVVADSNTNAIGIFFGTGLGTFTAQQKVSIGNNLNPRSVASGDFNSDSLLDIAVANYDSNTVAIIFGMANGTFTEASTYSTGSNSGPYFVLAADFNNDHQLDIAVVNYAAGNLGILLGDREGKMGKPMLFSTGLNSFPTAAAVCDFNKDHRLDIIVTNRGTDTFGVFYGMGNGSFLEQKVWATGKGSAPFACATDDFNNDSFSDIVVVNNADNSVSIYIAHLNDDFERIATYFIGDGSHPSAVSTGDFNRDALVDLVVTDFGGHSMIILFGNGNGMFGAPTKYSTGSSSYPVSVAVANFNQDRWLDIAIVNTEAQSVSIFLGLDPTVTYFQQIYSTGSNAHPYFVAASDFNNDALVDLAIVNLAHDNVGIRLGHGDGTFANELLFPTETGSRPQSITVGDFNNDHRADIAIANTKADSITVTFGCGNGSFSKQLRYSTGANSNPYFTVAADLNNDSRLDLAVVNEGVSTVGIFLSFDYATFKIESTLGTGRYAIPKWVDVADFNGDRLLDVVAANYAGSNVGVFFGLGNGSFAAQKTFLAGNSTNPYMVFPTDLNHDSLVDIAVANYDGGTIGILLGHGDGTFAEAKTFSTGLNSQPNTVVVADFNSDHHPDIVVANRGTDSIGLFWGYGDGTFAEQQTLSTGTKSGPRAIAVGDIDNDNYLDIVVANEFSHTVGLFRGYGNGTFSNQMIIVRGNSSYPHALLLAHFNDDDFLDIAVANRGNNNVGVRLGYGNSSFTSEVTYPTGESSITLTLAVNDLNNDRISDITAVNYGTDTVSVFYGYGDGTFTQQILFSTGNGTQPSGIAIGDFNNDTRLEFVVTNSLDGSIAIFRRDDSQPFLTMTAYSTENDSRASPRSMAVSDLNNDSSLDIVVTNYETSSVAFFFGHGNGTFGKREMHSTGAESHPCAIAIGDLNNDKFLDVIVATGGNSGIVIFFGYTNEIFSMAIVYSIEQHSISPALAVSDFNNDNYLDIAVTSSETHSMLFFYGNGNSTFDNPVSLSFGYGSEPNSLVVGDFNGDAWIDIVIVDRQSADVYVLLQTCDRN